MSYRIEDFENDPNWERSFGEKIGKIHFRNGHDHAVCDPITRICEIHYDEIDPHESPESLVKHMWGSNLGKGTLVVGGVAVLDQIFNGGKLRKSLFKYLQD